jgi:hypothetical protein
MENTTKPTAASMWRFITENFAVIANRIGRAKYTERVRDLRQNPRVGGRAEHFATDGRKHPGVIIDARFYRNGMVEIYFLSDDRVVNGWRDASSLLPEPE